MPNVSYSRRSVNEVERQIVAIRSVDLESNPPRAVGIAAATNHDISIDISYAVGEVDVVPATGEQWNIVRINGTWRLDARLPFQYPALAIPATEGQVRLGSGNGPVELVGTQVNVHSYMRIGNTIYRDNGGVLESSPADIDPPLWSAVTNGPGIDEFGFYVLTGVPIDADGFYDPMFLMLTGSFHL